MSCEEQKCHAKKKKERRKLRILQSNQMLQINSVLHYLDYTQIIIIN